MFLSPKDVRLTTLVLLALSWPSCGYRVSAFERKVGEYWDRNCKNVPHCPISLDEVLPEPWDLFVVVPWDADRDEVDKAVGPGKIEVPEFSRAFIMVNRGKVTRIELAATNIENLVDGEVTFSAHSDSRMVLTYRRDKSRFQLSRHFLGEKLGYYYLLSDDQIDRTTGKM